MRGRTKRASGFVLVAPALLLVGLIFVYPVAGFLQMSARGQALQRYRRAVTDDLYLRVFGETVELALIVAGTCLVLAYPLTYWLCAVRPWARKVAFTCILVTFGTSMLVRTYAWMVILGRRGVVNSFLTWSGLADQPVDLLYTKFAVVVGMVHVLLPFMILPLYPVMVRIDPVLTLAASGLGASGTRTFLKVYLPLTIPGITSGFLLVFILSLGYFITPALLGGGHVHMIAPLIVDEVQKFLNWQFAATLSTVLLLVTIPLYVVYSRFSKSGGGWF